ncbi:MAG: YifB family Mg chelatase-like AAA ATPase [Pseudomonadota bacterium]
MVAHIKTIAFQGIDAVAVDVQVQIRAGLPGFTIVGLPDKAVGESRERVQSALVASGLSLPAKRVTVNLAPADLPKEGSHFDLPIALGVMTALGIFPSDAFDDYTVLGELSLDGTVEPVTGVLPAAIYANSIEKGLLCPHESGPEAAWAGEDMDVLAPRSLLELVNHVNGTQIMARPRPSMAKLPASTLDLADIKGQETAKRALEVAAAGGHNLLMVGPPGSGKSMLASRLATILPPLSPAELLEVSMIASIAGDLQQGRLSDRRPFRAPHHSASMAAMVGGGMRAKPGEAALAHHGVLFLDELPEFSPQVLDSLRQPLETGETVIARANHRVSYPARFQLVAAMNPCRCGMAGEPGHTCKRGDRCAADYQARLSGPFLDRIDIRLDVPAVSALDLINPGAAEKSAVVAERVSRAREIQRERFRELFSKGAVGTAALSHNAGLPASLIDETVALDGKSRALLSDAAQAFQLSARAYHRVLKDARTLADLEQSDSVMSRHIAEAVSYRATFSPKEMAA